jgi:thiol-disulfide isomerase/thioredoxin
MSTNATSRRWRTGLIAALVVGVAAVAGFGVQRHFGAADNVATPPADAASDAPVAATAPKAKAVPAVLPEITLTDRDGTPRKLSQWQGKALVVNFWATWCPPCVREIPLLNRTREARHPQGFEVIGVAVDFREDVLKFAQERQAIGYPLLIGEEDGLAAVDAVGMSPAFPFTLFTDRQHRVVTVKVGELHDDELALVLDTILELDAGKIALEAAQSRINDGLRTLSARRAQAEAKT